MVIADYRKFLTPRLKTRFVGKVSYYDFYKRRPDEIKKALEKRVIIADGRAIISGGCWMFDYERYLQHLGYQIVTEYGYIDGLVFEVEKV